MARPSARRIAGAKLAGRNGRIAPNPSRPGIGSRLRISAVAWRKASHGQGGDQIAACAHARPGPKEQRQHQQDHAGGGRAGQGRGGAPGAAAHQVVAQIDRPAGKADAAERQGQQREDQGGLQIAVATRIEIQIALGFDGVVAAHPSGQGVAELVRHHAEQPPDHDEGEGQDVRRLANEQQAGAQCQPGCEDSDPDQVRRPSRLRRRTGQRSYSNCFDSGGDQGFGQGDLSSGGRAPCSPHQAVARWLARRPSQRHISTLTAATSPFAVVILKIGAPSAFG